MSELRMALLILGGVFLLALTLWELRRCHLEARSAAWRGGRRRLREPVIRDELPLLASTGFGVAASVPGAPEGPPEDEESALLARSGYVAVAPAGGLCEPAPLPVAREPIVEWPPDGQREIIALRLVSVLPERFAGHALRQALQSEGFVLGKFAIFHKPDESGRAVLSAASLTQPGSFDGDLDSLRYAGLSLFAVLPGPKPAAEAFDELLCAARGLNIRLEGALQDEHGRPLTPLRVAHLRASVGGAEVTS
jgi:hypothetical protein